MTGILRLATAVLSLAIVSWAPMADAGDFPVADRVIVEKLVWSGV